MGFVCHLFLSVLTDASLYVRFRFCFLMNSRELAFFFQIVPSWECETGRLLQSMWVNSASATVSLPFHLRLGLQHVPHVKRILFLKADITLTFPSLPITSPTYKHCSFPLDVLKTGWLWLLLTQSPDCETGWPLVFFCSHTLTVRFTDLIPLAVPVSGLRWKGDRCFLVMAP